MGRLVCVSGGLLTGNGQVQIGADTAATVYNFLCAPLTTGVSTGAWTDNSFNPFSGLELDTQDIPWQYQAGFYAGVDRPTVRKLEFNVIIAQPTFARSQLTITNAISILHRLRRPLSSRVDQP